MSARNVQEELKFLIEQLHLSPDDAYKTLGLVPDGDPLLLNDEGSRCNSPDGIAPPEQALVEMFPSIPTYQIRSVLAENNEDVDKATEVLLSWDLVKNEAKSQPGPKETKKEKNNRRQHRKTQRAIEAEESEISIIEGTLKVSTEEARSLYWTHDNDLSEVLMLKAPKPPLSVRSTPSARPGPLDLDIVRSVDEFSSMSRRDLESSIASHSQRIQTLQQKARAVSTKSADRTRAMLAAAEVRDLQQDLKAMRLALHKNVKLAPTLSHQRVDLHGCTLDQAKVIVAEVIAQFKQGSHSHIEIITGAGRHSVGGRPVLKTWLRAYLKQMNVRTEELEGSFVVSQRVHV